MIRGFREIPKTLREWLGWIGDIETQGKFTASLSGCTTAVTGTIEWVKIGRRITIWAPSTITGTSNSTGMLMSAFPKSILPAAVSLVEDLTIAIDNGARVPAAFSLNGANGFATFYMGSPLSSTGFTNSGTKGVVQGWSASWLLEK